MSKPRNNTHNKKFTKEWNTKKKYDSPKKDEHYLDAYKPGIEVRNGDVNKAIRILKKRLEKADFQKEMAKQAFYEKPSAKRKRKKDQAKKRWNKYVRDAEARGEFKMYEPTGTKWMKNKRKTREHAKTKQRQQAMLRSRGHL